MTRSVIVDVNNLLWTFSRPSAGIEPSFERLWPVVRAIRTRGVGTIIGVADASVVDLVGRAPPPDDLFDIYETVPPGTRADTRILELARSTSAFVVSNDRFRDEKKRDRWAKRNVHRIVITALPGESVHTEPSSESAVCFGANWDVLVDDPR